MSTRNEIEITLVPQHLKLLSNLWPDIVVVGIEPAQLVLKCIDVIDLKFLFPDRLDALHNLDEPASCFDIFVSKKESPFPLIENGGLGLKHAVFDEEYLSGLWHFLEKNVAAHPSSPSRSRR